jgi:hypothetical protein
MKGSMILLCWFLLASLFILIQNTYSITMIGHTAYGSKNDLVVQNNNIDSNVLAIELNIYGLNNTEGRAAVFLTILNHSYGSIVDLSRMDATDGLGLEGVTRTSLNFSGIPLNVPETFRICIFIPSDRSIGCYEDQILKLAQVHEAYILFR